MIFRVLGLALLVAAPSAAQTLRNDSGDFVNLRGGPAAWFPVVAIVAPGLTVDLGRCDVTGDWCLTSVDGIQGWLDTRVFDAPEPLAPPAAITVTPLPPEPGPDAVRPLPPEILDAVPPAVPGAQPPMLLSVTEPVGNVTGGVINLRVGPGTESAVIDQLQPGEGGVIELCTPSENWCRLVRPDGSRGWVKTTLVGLRRLSPR